MTERYKVTVEDQARANRQAITGLFTFLYLEGVIPPHRLRGLIETMAEKLEKDGDAGSAAVLRQMFRGALSGDWEQMRLLAKAETPDAN